MDCSGYPAVPLDSEDILKVTKMAETDKEMIIVKKSVTQIQAKSYCESLCLQLEPVESEVVFTRLAHYLYYEESSLRNSKLLTALQINHRYTYYPPCS